MSSKSIITNDRLDRIDSQLDRIAATLVKGFEQNKIEHEQMATKADIERIFRSLDAIAKRQEISDEEWLVIGHQLDRVNR